MKTLPVLAAFFVGATSLVHAQYQVAYDLLNNGADYTYDYTVFNQAGDPLKDFLIYFPDVASTEAFSYNLTSSTQPGGWTGTLVPPSAIDLGGFIEFLTAGGGILPGTSLGGFSATFEYNSPNNTPLGSQAYEVYDANFDLVASGRTVPTQPPGVPEQASSLSWALAIAGLAIFAKRIQPAGLPRATRG
jgi:hypothetical protein